MTLVKPVNEFCKDDFKIVDKGDAVIFTENGHGNFVLTSMEEYNELLDAKKIIDNENRFVREIKESEKRMLDNPQFYDLDVVQERGKDRFAARFGE